MSGFVPKEFRCEVVPATRKDEIGAWILLWKNTTEWRLNNKAWVPVHHEYRRPAGPFGRFSEGMTLDYRWENVNEPVKNDLFTYKTFKVGEEVGIQDMSEGTSK
jgi:hypothetical protein